jgi:arylsulfatase A-like enzyme/Flp pilus assembly protein TadD
MQPLFLRAFVPLWPRFVLAAAAALTVLAVLAAVFLRSGRSQVDLHPILDQNVLLITIDTLRADALGCYGGPAATPALDRLAAEGVRFDFAHAHAVLTLTSHASILTGEYPFEHGLRDNSGYRLPGNARTAATMLKRAGYATAAFVAAFPLHSRFGLNAGFDVYDDRFGESHAPTELNMPERPASAVVPLARSWIARAEQAGGAGRAGGADGTGGADKPWFVWVHVFDPHAPYRPPPPFDAQYAGRPYYGEVAATDAALAPLLDEVRSSARPTLAIVTADHGEALGDHGEESHGLFAYESTLRIPLIIAEVGGKVPHTTDSYVAFGFSRTSGEVSSVAARHVDILPTILEAIGQPVPPDLRGRTLLSREERTAGSPPRATYFEAMSGMLNRGWAPLTGVLVDHDKFVDLPIVERYELTRDPAERTNLAGRSPERDRVLAAALRAFTPTLPGQRVTEASEAAARLRALGYVSGDAPAKAQYSEADDPKRLVDLDRAVHRAVEAFGAGRAAEAVQLYRQVIDRRPDMAIAYRHLAFIEWQRGNAAEAVDVLRRAVARGVTDSRALAQLGGYLTDTGHIAEGIRILEPLARDPAVDADTLNALGIAFARAGRGEDARRVFERVRSVNPESSVPLENLGVLALDRGDVDGAKTYFDRAVALAPGSSRAHAGAGTAALKRGDHDSAYESWTRAVQLDPTNFEALYNLGVNLARDGRMDAARPYLEQFLRTAPPALYAKDLREVARILGH